MMYVGLFTHCCPTDGILLESLLPPAGGRLGALRWRVCWGTWTNATVDVAPCTVAAARVAGEILLFSSVAPFQPGPGLTGSSRHDALGE